MVETGTTFFDLQQGSRQENLIRLYSCNGGYIYVSGYTCIR